MYGKCCDCGIVAFKVANEGVVVSSEVSDSVWRAIRCERRQSDGRDCYYGSVWYWRILY